MDRWLCFAGECLRETSITRIDFHDGCAYLYVGETVARDAADVVVDAASDIEKLRSLVGDGSVLPWLRVRDEVAEADDSDKFANVAATSHIRILPSHTGVQAALLTHGGKQLGAVHEPEALTTLIAALGLEGVDLDAFAVRQLVTVEEARKTRRRIEELHK